MNVLVHLSLRLVRDSGGGRRSGRSLSFGVFQSSSPVFWEVLSKRLLIEKRGVLIKIKFLIDRILKYRSSLKCCLLLSLFAPPVYKNV